MSLERRAAAGAAWSFVATSSERLIGFAVFALILHFVPVADVGLVAIGTMLVDLANVIAVAGVAERVVGDRRRDRSVEMSSFWAHVLIAAGLSLLLLLLAPLAGRVYHEVRLVWVMRALSVIVMLNTLVVVPIATLTRDLRYREVGIMSVSATLVGALSAIPWAMLGYGAIALVVQRIAGVVFFVVALLFVTRWRPTIRTTRAETVDALRFCVPLIGSSMVDYLSRTGFTLVAGLRMSVVSLGYFRVAQRLSEVLQEVVMTSIGRIFLPLFVSIGDDPARRYQVACRIVSMMSIMVIGAFAISGAISTPLIVTMFGARLHPAAPVYAILSFLAPYIVISAFLRPLLISIGRNRELMYISLINAVTTGAVGFLVVPYGLTAMSAALVVRGFLALGVMAPFIRLAVTGPIAPLFGYLATPLLAGAASRVATWNIERLPMLQHLPTLTLLILDGAAAALVYVLVLLVLSRSRSLDVVRVFGRLMSTRLSRAGAGPASPPPAPPPPVHATSSRHATQPDHSDDAPALSVMLATRDRPEMLARTLESFTALVAPEGGWELLVVDNGSAAPTQALLARYLHRLPLTVLEQNSPGKSRALNRAVELVRGELVVLTDDDVLPEADWLVRLRQAALDHPAASYFGGTILPCWSAPPPRWLDAGSVHFGMLFALLERGSGPCDYREVYGPNMAVRRSVFVSGHRFSTGIGPDATTVLYPMGSEWDFNRRLHREGHQGWFVSEARVRHIIRTEQVTEKWVLQRAYRNGLGTGLIDPPSLTQAAVALRGVSMQLSLRLLLFSLISALLRPLPPSRYRLHWLFKEQWFKGLAAAIRGRPEQRPAVRDAAGLGGMLDATDREPG